MGKMGFKDRSLDPYVYIESQSGESAAIGIDDTDDNFKIVTSSTAGVTPSSANPFVNIDNATGFTEIRAVTNLTIDATSGIEINGAGAGINIGNDPVAQPINIGTGAAARTITMGNTTGATAVNMNIGTGDFTMTSASGTLISQLDTGEMTQPLQPAFLAELQATDSNVTGAGSTYTLGSGNTLIERYDQGGDFDSATGTFTAPVSGRYYLYATMRVDGLELGMTSAQFKINTSNRSYFWTGNAGNLRSNTGEFSFHLNVIADMDLGDTATNTMTISLGSGNVADITGSATTATVYFGGCLLV